MQTWRLKLLGGSPDRHYHYRCCCGPLVSIRVDPTGPHCLIFQYGEWCHKSVILQHNTVSNSCASANEATGLDCTIGPHLPRIQTLNTKGNSRCHDDCFACNGSSVANLYQIIISYAPWLDRHSLPHAATKESMKCVQDFHTTT